MYARAARATAAAVAALLLTACGSASDAGDSKGDTKGDSKPSVEYFSTSAVKGLNSSSTASYKAITKARARTSQLACDRAGKKGYVQWRGCWHALLDPVKTSLTSVAGELKVLTGRDFPEACITELEKGAETYLDFATRVQKLIDGIDSDQRKAQVRALRVYDKTLDGIVTDSNKPFQDATQACYSPKDLESINAKPTPSATPSG